MPTLKKKFSFSQIFLLAVFLLSACAGEDKPFSLVSDSNGPAPTVPSDSGSETPAGPDGCYVNFNGTLQLKVSAKKQSGESLEILDAGAFPIPPVPFKVENGGLILSGSDFPKILFETGNSVPEADLTIAGVSGTSATGTYDANTGAVEIPGAQLSVEISIKGTTDPLFGSSKPFAITGINLTTGSVTAEGNLNAISESGAPVGADGSVVLVAGVTLPTDFGEQSNLNGTIGGGALTARFEGSFDQLPQNCTEGGGNGGGGGGGITSPSELSVEVNGKSKLTEIDFGATLALVKQQGGNTVLDCSEAGNRGPVGRLVTITNTGSDERKIKLLKGLDTDDDAKDPLCSGTAEFVRGTVVAHGAATCATVDVGGKAFTTDECTIPVGAENKITFPLIYMPFNYVAPAEGSTEPRVDTGNLLIEYDDGKSFAVSLKGVTEPDSRDSLSVSKLVDGVPSAKRIPSGQLLKIALQDGQTPPFNQSYVINNASGDTWENVALSLEQGTSFTIVPPESTNLGPQADESSPGTLGFGITFNPEASGNSFSDVLTITLSKAGSGAELKLTYLLQGTIGVPPLEGNYELHIDFLSALIANPLLTEPLTSLDFRKLPDQAPGPQKIVIHGVDDTGVQSVDFLPDPFDVFNSSVEQRKDALRILTSKMTILDAQGTQLPSDADGTDCHEPSDSELQGPYQLGHCSYFYFNIATQEDSPGVYADETGNLTLPNLGLTIQQPYHGNVSGVWPDSAPGVNQLTTDLQVSFTTLALDSLEKEGFTLVPDSRISQSQLNLSTKASVLGPECPGDPVNGDATPRFRCFLTPDGKFIQGRPAALQEGSTQNYDVILVGVARFNAQSAESDIPIFMSDSNLFMVLQGKLCPEGSNCQ